MTEQPVEVPAEEAPKKLTLDDFIRENVEVLDTYPSWSFHDLWSLYSAWEHNVAAKNHEQLYTQPELRDALKAYFLTYKHRTQSPGSATIQMSVYSRFIGLPESNYAKVEVPTILRAGEEHKILGNLNVVLKNDGRVEGHFEWDSKMAAELFAMVGAGHLTGVSIGGFVDKKTNEKAAEVLSKRN